jgi:uncharacterized Tic20 family protein
MNLADELQKLQKLRESGALNDEEFSLAKAKLLNESPASAPAKPSFFASTSGDATALEQETRRWAFLLHLSVLLGLALPIAGLIVPIVIWQMKKPVLPGIEEHGINVINWIISLIIYSVGSAILIFVVVGIPMLMVLGVLAVVFPIIAAIKANNGEVWKYPLSISIVKPSPISFS